MALCCLCMYTNGRPRQRAEEGGEGEERERPGCRPEWNYSPVPTPPPFLFSQNQFKHTGLSTSLVTLLL